MKTICTETFKGKIKVGTDGVNYGICVLETGPRDGIVKVDIKEIDGTKPLGQNECWMKIDEFIEKMDNSEMVHAVLRKFIKMGYKIEMKEPKK